MAIDLNATLQCKIAARTAFTGEPIGLVMGQSTAADGVMRPFSAAALSAFLALGSTYLALAGSAMTGPISFTGSPAQVGPAVAGVALGAGITFGPTNIVLRSPVAAGEFIFAATTASGATWASLSGTGFTCAVPAAFNSSLTVPTISGPTSFTGPVNFAGGLTQNNQQLLPIRYGLQTVTSTNMGSASFLTGADPFGTSGNTIAFDSAQGQGLANLTAGAVIGTMYSATSSTAYVYSGTRGASQLKLEDGAAVIQIGTLASGAGQAQGTPVTWAIPISITAQGINTAQININNNGFAIPSIGNDLNLLCATGGAGRIHIATTGGPTDSNISRIFRSGTSLIFDNVNDAYSNDSIWMQVFRTGLTTTGIALNATGSINLNTPALTFVPANPTIQSGGSYIIIPNGLFVSGGPALYVEPVLNARGGIGNDAGGIVVFVQPASFNSTVATALNYVANSTNGTGQFSAVTGGTCWNFYNDGADCYLLKNSAGTTGFDGSRPWRVHHATSQVFIDGTGAGTTFSGVISIPDGTVTSDVRLKRNIVPVNNAVDIINRSQAYEYDKAYGDGQTLHQIGFIAQDIQKFAPHLVKEGPPLVYDTGALKKGEVPLEVKLNSFIPLLVEYVKVLHMRIAALEDN